MRPGQIEPNEFEIAIIKRFAQQDPSIRKASNRLHVLSREFTGVGSFTNFKCIESQSSDEIRTIDLNAQINMPGVPNGLGAVLFCKGNQLDCLEIHTYGDDKWDGVYDGFSID